MSKISEHLIKFKPTSCNVNLGSNTTTDWVGGGDVPTLPDTGGLYFNEDLPPFDPTRYGLTQAEYSNKGGGKYFKSLQVYKDSNGKLTRNVTNNPAGDLIQELPFTLPDGKTTTVEINIYVKDSLQKIFNEIRDYNAKTGFGFKVGASIPGWRSSSSGDVGTSSVHCRGLAVDINPGTGGNPWFGNGKDNKNIKIPHNQGEHSQGQKPIWGYHMIKSKNKKTGEMEWKPQVPYPGGTYDKTKCLWHWAHPVVQIFIRNGWGWGGSYGDVMHFSLKNGH